MRPHSRHNNRSAIAVIAWIVDVLYSGSDINSAPNVGGVIRFDDILPPVGQMAIAQQETQPAIRQINLVIFLDAVRHKGNAGAVLLAMPERAVCADALIECGINFRISERFGFSVAPTPAGEGGEVLGKILFQIYAEPVLAGDVPGGVRDWGG